MNAFATGFAVSPSLDVLGAFFPDWMFCIVGAVLLTVLMHCFLRSAGTARRAGRWIWLMVYPSLGILFALSGWLLFFQN